MTLLHNNEQEIEQKYRERRSSIKNLTFNFGGTRSMQSLDS